MVVNKEVANTPIDLQQSIEYKLQSEYLSVQSLIYYDRIAIENVECEVEWVILHNLAAYSPFFSRVLHYGDVPFWQTLYKIADTSRHCFYKMLIDILVVDGDLNKWPAAENNYYPSFRSGLKTIEANVLQILQ